MNFDPFLEAVKDQQHLKETPMAPLVDPREKAEKGPASLSTPGDRFAYWLSQIASPFVVGLGVLGYVALSTASTVTEGLRWLTGSTPSAYFNNWSSCKKK